MKQVTFVAFSLVLCVGMVACDTGDQRLRDKAAIEAEQAAKKQVEADRKYVAERSSAMEADLNRRHLFYSAVSGTYEGLTDDGTGRTMRVRFTFSPSLPRYNSERVRAIEEVVFDLNNLNFNVSVVQWDRGGLGFGCVFQGIRPDLKTGVIRLMSSECTSSYVVMLGTENVMPSEADTPGLMKTSGELADSILVEKLVRVQILRGFRESTKGGSVFPFVTQNNLKNE